MLAGQVCNRNNHTSTQLKGNQMILQLLSLVPLKWWFRKFSQSTCYIKPISPGKGERNDAMQVPLGSMREPYRLGDFFETFALEKASTSCKPVRTHDVSLIDWFLCAVIVAAISCPSRQSEVGRVQGLVLSPTFCCITKAKKWSKSTSYRSLAEGSFRWSACKEASTLTARCEVFFSNQQISPREC